MTYEQILEELAREDERIVVMTAENRAAIRNLPSKLGDRFIDVGISEMTMIGAAAGLALRGRIPITHALSTFITLRPFEFVRTDLGIPNLPVKLVGGVPGFLSEANGPTHQAVEDISLMRGIPNMCIFAPADTEDLEIGLRQIIRSDSPFYIRHTTTPPVVKHDPLFEIGVAERVSDGSEITLLTYGFMLRETVKTKEILEGNGHSVRVLNMRTLKPIDEEAILRAADETRLLVTIEDHFLTGGLYSIVAETFLKHHTSANVIPFALNDRWFKPALLEDVLKFEGFTGEQIAASVMCHPLYQAHFGKPLEKSDRHIFAHVS
ncbi:MAG: transketolase C-terminal domain-containing protein [Candidatus Kapaibacterium sp.]